MMEDLTVLRNTKLLIKINNTQKVLGIPVLFNKHKCSKLEKNMKIWLIHSQAEITALRGKIQK